MLSLVANEATSVSGMLFADKPTLFGMTPAAETASTEPARATSHSFQGRPSIGREKRGFHRQGSSSPGPAGTTSPSPLAAEEDLPSGLQPGHIYATARADDMTEEMVLAHLAVHYAYADSSISSHECCASNRAIALQLHLPQRAALWSTLHILLHQLATPLSKSLISSLLNELLDNGDCQSYVVCVEILRRESTFDVSIVPRLREGYLMYIELLRRFKLHNISTALLKNSDDAVLSQLTKAGSVLFTSCSLCGKELPEGLSSPWCSKCKRCVSICSFCEHPVKGLLHWCPICAHGGHSECMVRWFSQHGTCASGCGHNCCFVIEERRKEDDLAVKVYYRKNKYSGR